MKISEHGRAVLGLGRVARAVSALTASGVCVSLQPGRPELARLHNAIAAIADPELRSYVEDMVRDRAQVLCGETPEAAKFRDAFDKAAMRRLLERAARNSRGGEGNG